MPRRYKKKNASKRKTYNNNRRQLTSLNRQPVPSNALVKLRYCQTISIDAAAGVTNSRLFRCNSLYDPDYSSTDPSQHQPLGYDQWMAFYSQYCVLGSKMVAQPINTQTTVPLQFGIALRQGGITLAVDPIHLREQGDSSWNYAGNMVTSGRCKPVVKKFSTKRFLGYKNPQDETACKASESGNPAESAYYQVWCAAADGSSNPAPCTFQITIDFIAMLSQPKQLIQS